MTDRVSLLRAILARPREDTPRLAFADWLDEHGTTDADRARAEFLRLSCKLKPKAAISPIEAKWLDANWRRLLPATVALFTEPWPQSAERKGRFLSLWVGWTEDGRLRHTWLQPEFVRGFVGEFGFKDRPGYDRFRAAVAADDPVAVLAPVDLPRVAERDMRFKAVVVYPEDWGDDVFARVGGFDEELPGRWKRFVTRPHTDRTPPEVWDPQHRARQAISDAMTAIAREANGLATPANPTEPA